MSYQVKIVNFNKVTRWTSDIVVFDISPDYYENLNNLIDRYNQDFNTLFREIISLDQSSNFEAQTYENLSQEELINHIRKLESDCIHLEKTKEDLKRENLQLGEKWVNKDRERLRGEVLSLEEKAKEISRLSTDLDNERSTNQRLRQKINGYQTLQVDHQNLLRKRDQFIARNNDLARQIDRGSKFEVENNKLRKSNNNLQTKLSSLEEELNEARQKLGLATSRLHEKTVKPGIAGGGSFSDQLKQDFDNLKRGLFHETSRKILNSWREQESELKFRSEEFSQIKSILSKSVFIDGMSYFAVDNPEVNASTQSIITELLSVKELSLERSILPDIEDKIANVLRGVKSVDETDQNFIEYVETTIVQISEHLQKIREYPLLEEARQGIKEFVQEGLKLVNKVIKDTSDNSSGKFYLPEIDTKFNDLEHNTRDETEGKIKLTICAGYRTEGTILTKADVITYISDTASDDTDNDAGETEDFGASEQPSDELNPTDSEQKENKNNYVEQDNSSTISKTITQDSPDPIHNESSPDENSNDSEEANSGKKIDLCSFTGTVKPKKGVELYSQPYDNDEQYGTGFSVRSDQEIKFDAWCCSDEMEFKHQKDRRWYRCQTFNIDGQQCWVPASHIQGEPPNSSSFPSNKQKGENQ